MSAFQRFDPRGQFGDPFVTGKKFGIGRRRRDLSILGGRRFRLRQDNGIGRRRRLPGDGFPIRRRRHVGRKG